VLTLSISCLIELWQLKVKADSDAPSGRYCLLAAVLGCLGLFVGQDVGSNTTRSVENDWLPDEKVI
jgi:hypothetical protein